MKRIAKTVAFAAALAFVATWNCLRTAWKEFPLFVGVVTVLGTIFLGFKGAIAALVLAALMGFSLIVLRHLLVYRSTM